MTRTTSYLLRSLMLLMLAALVVSAVAVVLASPPAQAAPFTVTTAADEQNTNAQCSLREAIINANQNDQSGSADCPAGVGEDTITFNLVSPATITLGSQLPTITDSAGLIIDGGSAKITLSGNGAVRVFQVDGGAKLTLNNLTVANGNASTPGSPGIGGGIHNAGTLTVSNSTISGNIAGNGGGIYNQGTLTVSNSTISGNSANFAGGIYNPSAGTLTVNNSTISNNTGFIEIGGIYGSPNTTTTTTLKNTIVANNTEGRPNGENCSGNITNGGYNLDSGTSCGFGTTNNSLSSTDPMLGVLADNGGPTKTHALLAGSPAIDKGVAVAGITTDQRGVTRPQGAAPDIGAFEVQSPPDTKAPKVTNTTVPAAGATRVAPGVNVTATFSEAMDAITTDGDPSTISGTTFKLMRAGTTTAIGAVVSYDSTANKATLNPNANLRLGTKYKAVVTTEAEDLAGNQLDQNSNQSGLQQKSWTFTTRN